MSSAASEKPAKGKDVVFGDETLSMPGDDPELVRLLRQVEEENTICFRGRWYIARCIRKIYDPNTKPWDQAYFRELWDHECAPHGYLAKLQEKPFHRFEFEAARIWCRCRRGQPNWEYGTYNLIIRMAYEQYGWTDIISDGDVDAIIADINASSDGDPIDPRAFDVAERMDADQKRELFDSSPATDTSLSTNAPAPAQPAQGDTAQTSARRPRSSRSDASRPQQQTPGMGPNGLASSSSGHMPGGESHNAAPRGSIIASEEVVAMRNSVLDFRAGLVKRGERMVTFGNVLGKLADVLQGSGTALLRRGTALLKRGIALLDKGRALLEEGVALVEYIHTEVKRLIVALKGPHALWVHDITVQVLDELLVGLAP